MHECPICHRQCDCDGDDMWRVLPENWHCDCCDEDEDVVDESIPIDEEEKMEMEGEEAPVIIEWDYKETPHWGKITLAVQSFYTPYLLPVDDTHGDSDAVVIAGNVMLPEEVQTYYDQQTGYATT